MCLGHEHLLSLISIFTYLISFGFGLLQTSEALQKALEKEKVYIKGVRIRKEPSSSTPKALDRNGNLNPLAVDSPPPRNPDSFLGPAEPKGRGTGYSISVEGVPLHIPLTAVKKALSKYGEIALSSKKEVGEGDYAAHVEFKVNTSLLIRLLRLTNVVMILIWLYFSGR